MNQGTSSYTIHLRTGFFRLDLYEMVVSSNGIHFNQSQQCGSVGRIHLSALEVQKVIIYLENIPEIEIITPREVFTGVISKKTDLKTLESILREHFGSRIVIL